MIVDREVDLLHQLQTRVLAHEDLLVHCSRIISELDCLLAFTEIAIKHRYVRPMMTNSIKLEITNGRHPLREMTTSAFVPNDTLCHGYESDTFDASPNLIVLTGANYSGKSIYLKQVALIVFMAHLGSFVPADAAIIGVTDRILTRLQTRESLSKELSAFMLDLQEVSFTLQVATPRSLLIIDEFGKGTDSTSGASLFAALVEHLSTSLQWRPRSLVATHFHEVLTSEVMSVSPTVAYKHMEVVVDKNSDPMLDNLIYLYHLKDGPSLGSFGLNCAAMGGILPHVLSRAEQFLSINSRGESLIEALSEVTEAERERLVEAESVARKFLSWDIEAVSNEDLFDKLLEVIN